MNRLAAIGMVLSMLWTTTLPARAAEQLVLSSGMHEPWTNTEGTGFTNRFVAELFQRLGRSAAVTFNPAAARALQLANDGTDDGLAARIAGLDRDYSNLIAVPEPIFVNDFVAATLSGDQRILGWDDLRPHSVAHILGWQVFERQLPPVRELTLAKDSRQLLGLLKAGRTEIILHERWQALWQARQQGLPLTIHQPPLVSTPMYIYLHRRHAALVPHVAAELRAMKAEGRDRAIMADIFAKQAAAP